MNKSELCEAVAAECDISKCAARRVVDSAINVILKKLSEGESVTLAGFGSFVIENRRPRTGRNLYTGEPFSIPARRVARFRFSRVQKNGVI